MIILMAVTAVALIVSLIANRRKTVAGLRVALKKFLSALPMLTIVIIAAGIALYFLDEEFVSANLAGTNNFLGALGGLVLGSVAVLPGFVVFPLGGILRQAGVPFMVISAFTTSLMMVGVVTLPVERKYFGLGPAVLRNAVSLGIAMAVSLATGLVFGEIW